MDYRMKVVLILAVCLAVGLLAFAAWGLWKMFLGPRTYDDTPPPETPLEAAHRLLRSLEERANRLEDRLGRLEQIQRNERGARSLAETRAETGFRRSQPDEEPLDLIERAPQPPPPPPPPYAPPLPPRDWRDEAPFPDRASPFAAPRREPPSDREALGDLRADPTVRAVLDRFNRLAAAGDRPGLQAFAADQGCVPLAEVAGSDDLAPDEDGPLWWVEVDSERFGLLLPSQQTVQQWDKFYRSLSGQRAKDKLGAAFDIQEGDVLQIAQPAWARRVGGQTFRRVERGRLLGI